MGKDKSSSSTQTTTRVIPTDEETELNKMMLERQRVLDPQITGVQGQQLDLASTLLAGENLPGNLSLLGEGISSPGKLGTLPTLDPTKYQVGEETTSGIVEKSLGDIAPQFQHLGVLDSGVAASLSNALAGDIRLQTDQSNKDIALGIDQSNIQNQAAAQQFDIQNQFSQDSFDINTLLSLLNLTLSGSTTLQSPALQNQAQLSTALAGLRGTSTDSSTHTAAMNPFMKSFQTSFGENMGVGASAATFAAACWVAKEIYGSWEDERTHKFRWFVLFESPKWFRELYMTKGKQFAKYISDKPIIRAILRPFFEVGSAYAGFKRQKHIEQTGIPLNKIKQIALYHASVLGGVV